MLGRQGRRCPLRLDVAAEQLQDLAEGQIGVTDAGDGIAITGGHHQVRVRFHRLAGKFTQQGCLAAPRLAGHEGHPSRAGESLTEVGGQPGQSILASNERQGRGNKWTRR